MESGFLKEVSLEQSPCTPLCFVLFSAGRGLDALNLESGSHFLLSPEHSKGPNFFKLVLILYSSCLFCFAFEVS